MLEVGGKGDLGHPARAKLTLDAVVVIQGGGETICRGLHSPESAVRQGLSPADAVV